MGEIPDEQLQLLRRRADCLQAFVSESLPVVGEFLADLELPDSYSFVENVEPFLVPVDAWLGLQTITSDDRVWLITRIGYLIGEILSQRLGGRWKVDDDPASPYFTQYVLGDFTKLVGAEVVIPPLAIAANLIDEPPGRSLIATVARAEDATRRFEKS